jgi:hypothetical protein
MASDDRNCVVNGWDKVDDGDGSGEDDLTKAMTMMRMTETMMTVMAKVMKTFIWVTEQVTQICNIAIVFHCSSTGV